MHIFTANIKVYMHIFTANMGVRMHIFKSVPMLFLTTVTVFLDIFLEWVILIV